MVRLFRLLPAVFILATTSSAMEMRKFRAISVEHIWQEKVPIQISANLGNQEEVFTINAKAKISGKATDTLEVAESLDDLKKLVTQKNCDNNYTPNGELTVDYENVDQFGSKIFRFWNLGNKSGKAVTHLMLEYLDPSSAELGSNSSALKKIYLNCSNTPVVQENGARAIYFSMRDVIGPQDDVEVKGISPIYFSGNHPFKLKFSVFGRLYERRGNGFIASPVLRKDDNFLGETMTGQSIAEKYCKDFQQIPAHFVFYINSFDRNSSSTMAGGFALTKFKAKANAVGVTEIGIEDQGGVHPVICH